MHVLILGAGPAGLAAGYELSKNGIRTTILEADSIVGGLSRTVDFDGYSFDMGGHRFFSKIAEVNRLWKEVLPDEFIRRKRLSRIYYGGKFYLYPLQFPNVLSNLGLFESGLIFLSYLRSKAFPFPEEKTFEQWVCNRFGARLYSKFFKTYTEKVWGMPCNQIQAEWAAQRIKGLSLISAVVNSIRPSNNIKTLISEFHYPRLGPGMMYSALADRIQEKKGKIILGARAEGVERRSGKWQVRYTSGEGEKNIIADEVISSIPITEMVRMLYPKVPEDIEKVAGTLKYRSFLVSCLVFDKPTLLRDNWIYIHEKSVRVGRLQVIKNWSPHMVRDHSNSSYGAEYFCTEGDDLWSMKDEDIVSLSEKELKQIALIPKSYRLLQGNIVRCRKAYPVYNDYYKKNIGRLKGYISGVRGLQTIGRAGMFKYNNMDHSIYTGMLAARNIVKGRRAYDLWRVNLDEEYHETASRKKSYEVYEVNPPLEKGPDSLPEEQDKKTL